MVEERVAGQLVINQPAGHVESGETLLHAVIREAREETAWRFIPEALIGVYLWGKTGHPRFLRVAFSGRCDKLDLGRSLDTGIVRTLWLRRDELLARTGDLRSPMVLRGVDDYLSGRRYPLDLVQDLALEQLARRAEVV
jgi:8-oxo-dGTP pyrophosphatase MutT (NUDIX family)